MTAPVDHVDVEARLKAARILHEKFKKVLEDIKKGRPPKLLIPKRTLSNTIFDRERGILVLGDELLEREFLDMGEARRFMQTLLMASIIYQALVENEYPTIRDLYYRGKHTIMYKDLRGRTRQENTWEEQSESDSALRDVEVMTGLLREDMLILSKEKGKVVGNMRIRSGGDVIDLSRLGHGAYAIESTPDLIEFLDWDAEFVLVVEKDAVFQQLHRIGFWRKYKSILVTGAGQPDRATRRFVRRLNEELGLPVYVLTDSIPGDEVVIVRDTVTGAIHVGPVEELLAPFFTDGVDREWVQAPLEVPSMNPRTGRIEWKPVIYAYRHRIDGHLLEIKTRGRGTIRVTEAHSLFVLRDGRIKVVPAKDIKPGDRIIVAEKIPLPSNHGNANTGYTFNSPNKLWLLGLLFADGNINQGKYIRISLNPESETIISKAKKVIEEELSLHVTIYQRKDRRETQVIACSREVAKELARRNLTKSRNRRLPNFIFNLSPSLQLEFLKGLIDGDGSLDDYGDIIYSTRSPVMSKQVFTLMLMLGINPTLVQSGGDHIIRVSKNPHRTPKAIYEKLSGAESGSKANRFYTETIYGLPYTRRLKKLVIRLTNNGEISYSNSAKTISKAKLKRVLELSGSLPEDYEIMALGDVVPVEVVEVRKTRYVGYVYDFGVEGNNSFIGGYGVVYHNSDPYGFYIYSVYKIGSIQLSYESERLATPRARFLGVMMSDIFGWRGKRAWLSERERRAFIIRAKDVDVKRARELLKYPWFRGSRWRRELGLFLEKRVKLEIEALASKGLRFLAFKYIPEKIETGDWIE